MSRSTTRVIAALAIGAYAGLSLLSFNVLWNPSVYGEFGLDVDPDWRVNDFIPGSPAANAGLRVGDAVYAHSIRDRLMITSGYAPQPGQHMTINVDHEGRLRSVTLRAATSPPRSASAIIAAVLRGIAAVGFLGFGLVLVLLRPSKATWGLYLLVPVATAWLAPALNGGSIISSLPTGWLAAFELSTDFAGAAASAGLLMFCLRFPNVTPVGWQAALDRSIPHIFIALSAILIGSDAANIFLAEPMPFMNHVAWVTLLVMLVLALLAFSTNFARAKGLERHKIQWVALGVSCAAFSALALILSNYGVLSDQVYSLCAVLIIALPLSVAYTIFRHRVIDVRFVLSRSIFFGIIGFVMAIFFIGIDWLFSIRLPNSRFEVVVYVGLALLAGFVLNAGRQRLGSTIDYLFFRKWHRTRQKAEALADLVRQAARTSDLCGPLTEGIVRAFSLASSALFERVEDGGYVRIAACGWPAGTLWHLLADQPLVSRVSSTQRPIDVTSFPWADERIPSGVARPITLLPIVARGTALAILLLGAHEDGTGLAPDELKMIRGLCADASLAYGDETAPGWERIPIATPLPTS